jgi:hypothetical protein
MSSTIVVARIIAVSFSLRITLDPSRRYRWTGTVEVSRRPGRGGIGRSTHSRSALVAPVWNRVIDVSR